VLKGKIPQLEESIVKARTDKAARQWWAAVAGKAGNPTAESLNAKELIAALQPTGGVLDSIKKSGGLTQDDVLHFLYASGDDSMVRLTQSWAHAISDEQPFSDQDSTESWCSVVANLLQSRLAMPIMYPLNPQLGQLKDRNPIAVSRFSQEQVAQTLAHVAPAVVGLTHMARVLKAGHALEYYAKSGGRRRFRRRVRDLPKDNVKYRWHRLRIQHHKKFGIVSKTGLAHGWSRYGGGRPADAWLNTLYK
ncbi:hypothetical protein FOL46_002166, partial [Perkinsus olseni]